MNVQKGELSVAIEKGLAEEKKKKVCSALVTEGVGVSRASAMGL